MGGGLGSPQTYKETVGMLMLACFDFEVSRWGGSRLADGRPDAQLGILPRNLTYDFTSCRMG